MTTSFATPYSNNSAIAGSWFPTGFHGHSRTGRRNDFLNEFRYRAKPSPPVVFIQRAMERPESHSFSIHDNREAYLRPEQSCAKRELSEKGAQTRLFDGEFFDLGLGRRKIQNSSQKSDRKMFWWAPQQVDFEATGCPQLSLYRSSYNAQQTPKQVYIPLVNPDNGERFTTIYRHTYGANQSKNGVINVMNNVPLGLTPSPPKNAPPVTMGRRRPQTSNDTVRSCLIWSSDQPYTHMKVSEASTTTVVANDARSNDRSAPTPMPAGGLCEEYPAKPLVVAPMRGNVQITPYSNEASMAAMANKQRSSDVLNTNVQKPTVKIAELPTKPETKPQVESNSGGLARSRSEASISRPKTSDSIVFTTRLW